MNKEKAVVIIPTYNERENIGRMIEVLEEKFLMRAIFYRKKNLKRWVLNT